MFFIKIYTARPLPFYNYEHYVSKFFVTRKFLEFKSLLRSPHANKNAQEQFYKIKYIYKIEVVTFTQVNLFLRRVMEDQSANIKTISVKKKKTILYTSN